MNKKLLLTVSLVAFFASAGFALANLTQVELQPQSSFTCNATGTIYYSLSNNQLMLCTSGSASSPVLTSSGSSGTGASFSTITVSGTSTFATSGGFIGIGTASPSSPLTVNGSYGSGHDGYLVNILDTQSSNGILRLGMNAYDSTGVSRLGEIDWRYDLGSGTTTGMFLQGTSNGGSSIAYMSLIPAGVGINTVNPATTLDVNGNINVGYVLYDRSNTNYYLNPSGNVMPYALNVGGGVNSSAGYSIGGNPVWETATITLANGPGWYRILQTTAGWLNGTIRLYGTGGSNITTDSMFSISQNRYNHQGSIQVLRAGNYNGTHIAELRLGADGNYTYLDVQFAGINTPTTLYLDYSGQISGIQTSPAFNPTAPTYIGAQMPGAAYGVDNGVDSPYPILLNPDGNGDIGIGTTGPGTNLDVVGGTFFDTLGGVALTRAVTIKSNGRAQLSYGAYPWEWSPSLQLQSVNNNRFLWMNAGADNGSYNARIAVGGNGLDFYTNATTTANGTLALSMNTSGRVGVGTATPSSAGLVIATNVSGAAVDVQNNRIINVGTPINAADAATKSYVDSAIAGGSGSSVGYWTLSGSNLYPSGSYNVGLGGQTSPVYNLDVGTTAGTVNIRGSSGQLYTNNISPNSGSTVYINNSSNLNVAGTVTAGSGTVGSLSLSGNTLSATTDRLYLEGSNNCVTLGNPYSSSGSGITSCSGGSIQGQGGSWANTGLYLNPGGGNVGINTGSPGTNLDVNGNINASIYYDRDNTSYYLDPAANVMPYAANLGGSVNITGNLAVNNGGTVSQIFSLPQTAGTAQWIKLGTFNANQQGYDVMVRIAASNGYNANYNQNQVSYIHFKSSNAGSVDGNGFAGDSWWYTTGPNTGSPSSIKWVANASGTSATAFTLYGYFGTYTGQDSFYAVDTPPGTSWTNYSSGGQSDPGSGSGTVLVAHNQMFIGSSSYFRNSVGIGTASPNYALSVSGSMYSIEVDNGTATGATTIDWSQSNTQTLVLGASPIALTFSNGQPGAHYTLALKQDATGSRLVTWPGNVRWSSGVAPTLTTTANKTDYVEFVYDGLSSTFDGVGFNANF